MVSMGKQKSNKSRTYARNRSVVSRRGLENVWESDGIYVLKLVLVTLAGLFWLRLETPLVIAGFLPVGAIPVGSAIAALVIAWLEKAQFNRKIMYAVLVIVTIIGFFINAGIVL